MRYEPSDCEWTAIKPMLPNKPRRIRRVTTVACSMAPFGFCVQVRRGATCQRPMAPVPSYNRFVRWRRAGV
jgi:transposase